MLYKTDLTYHHNCRIHEPVGNGNMVLCVLSAVCNNKIAWSCLLNSDWAILSFYYLICEFKHYFLLCQQKKNEPR